MFGLIRLRCQGNQKFFKRELNAFNMLLSDVSFLEFISDAIKTCLIFGCSCSSRPVSYFCHNSLRTNCLERALFVPVWSSRSNQADIYSTLELIFVQMNGLLCQRAHGHRWFVSLWCIWASYSALSIHPSVHMALKGKRLYFDWNKRQILFLAALSLCDFITPSGPPSTLANYSVSPALAGSCTHIDQSA